MRLGASLRPRGDDPEQAARTYAQAGYSAGICPPVTIDQPERIRAIRDSFARHNVLLAEVGVWNNMMDIDLAYGKPTERQCLRRASAAYSRTAPNQGKEFLNEHTREHTPRETAIA